MPESKKRRGLFKQKTKFSDPNPDDPGGSGRSGHGGMHRKDKAEDAKQALKDLLQYIKPYLPLIIVSLVLGAASSVLSLMGPGYLSEITDLITVGIFETIDLGVIVGICGILAVLYSSSFLFGYLQTLILASVTQQLTKELRSQISDKINRIPLKYFDTHPIGDVLSRVTNDVDMIGQTLNNSVGTLISSVTLFIGAVFMMYLTNVLMATSAILVSVLGFLLMMIIMSRSQKYFLAQQKNLGEMNGYIEEIYTRHQIVKAYNGEKNAEKGFDEINKRLYHSAWISRFLGGLIMPLMSFVGNFGYVVVCVLGAVLVAKGNISFGVIVSFMVYVRLFTQPLMEMGQVFASLQSTLAASERVFRFLGEEEMEDESRKERVLLSVEGKVEFDHLQFGYDPDRIIIHDFSATAKAGEKIAIVGPTGAGKTTIVNLLMRFYEPGGGEIRIDGVPIAELTRENVHNLFCMVLQDTWLFEGTLRENLIYSKENVDEERLNRICRAVGLEHYIRTLPDGYDTVLDEKTTLSAGQRQLVTIARAMIENAPMLILDEATSSVDTRTELVIQQAMDALTKGRTSFVIAHRLSTIKNADLIFVMKEGNIVESGKHEELLEKNGFYAELYNSQFTDV